MKKYNHQYSIAFSVNTVASLGGWGLAAVFFGIIIGYQLRLGRKRGLGSEGRPA